MSQSSSFTPTDACNVQTASLLTFGIYALSRNSEILSKLREEIASVVGRRAPTYDDIRNMKYLRAFLNGKCGLTCSIHLYSLFVKKLSDSTHPCK